MYGDYGCRTGKEVFMNPQVLTERFEMRLGQSDLDELDAWRARQTKAVAKRPKD